MELTIQKTIEEKITISDLPKYYKESLDSLGYYKLYRLSESGILSFNDSFILFQSKSESKHFNDSVLQCMKYTEITENEFYEKYNEVLTMFKIL